MRQLVRMWDVRIALVAAFVLVLQAMSSGFTTGSMAATTAVDVFGNPICVTSADHVGDATGNGGNQHLGGECCTMGCASATAFAPPPPVDAVAIRPALYDGLPAGAALVARPRHSDYDPASPRAPPRLA